MALKSDNEALKEKEDEMERLKKEIAIMKIDSGESKGVTLGQFILGLFGLTSTGVLGYLLGSKSSTAIEMPVE